MDVIQPRARSAALITIVLLALALRLAPWGQNRFLEDEALYGYWGLQIATATDPMLDLEPVDKPPLHPYTLALSFLLAAPQQAVERAVGLEAMARLPSLFASVTSIALVYALGRVLSGDVRVGLLAALLLALSSFDILFASTAFTDSLMTALVLGALLAAAKGRLGAAGVLAGLATATKQQGFFFLPLVVGVGLVSVSPSRDLSRPGKDRSLVTRRGPAQGSAEYPKLQGNHRFPQPWQSRWVRFVLGFGLVAGGMIWWDLAREQRPGFLGQSLISYGGLGLAQPQALGQRAVDWLGLSAAFWASSWFNALLVGAVIAWLIVASRIGTRPPQKVDLVLLIFVGSFLALHWLVGFQVWDRYLLGLVPLVALMGARAFVALGDGLRTVSWRRVYVLGLGLILILTLAGPVVQATRSELPSGGDHGAYDGIEDLAAYMRVQAPPEAVLYHHWLGYHYHFYLYGTPLRLHWYPDVQDLARDAVIYRREPRYIAFPNWRDGVPAEAALAASGIALEPVLETTRRDGTISFRLYRLEGP